MKRVWPWWQRTAVSVALVLLAYWPYAGWHWHSRPAAGPGVFALSPTGKIVRKKSLMSLLVDPLSQMSNRRQPWVWKFSYAFATTVPAAIIGVVAFALLTRRFGASPEADSHCRCRKCQYILNGLSEPRCPECGEPV